jgi:hypothetical protein
MSEYHVVPTATYSPTNCFFCLEYEGPFIDTNVEAPGVGHIYICGPTEKRPGCIGQMAALFGLPSLEQKEMAKVELEALTEKVEELEQRKETVQLTYDDLLKAMAMPKRTTRTLKEA